MITTLIGQNGFLLQQHVRQLRNDFVTSYGDLALETVDVSDYEVGKVLDILGALPFLSPKRMVFLEGLAANKPAAEQIEALLDSVSDVTDLILVEPKIDKRSVLYKTLKKKTDLHEFAEIDARDAPRWLVMEAKKHGGILTLADANYIVSRVGAGQQLLASELNKLLLYNNHVTRESINELTEQAPLSNIFDLIEAAFAGNMKRALSLYDDQRAQNVDALAIEALFVWQLHILLLMKTAGQKSSDAIASDAGISPYVAKKSARLCDMRTLAQLKDYVSRLAEVEYAIKTTAVDADELMKNFIVLLGV